MDTILKTQKEVKPLILEQQKEIIYTIISKSGEEYDIPIAPLEVAEKFNVIVNFGDIELFKHNNDVPIYGCLIYQKEDVYILIDKDVPYKIQREVITNQLIYYLYYKFICKERYYTEFEVKAVYRIKETRLEYMTYNDEKIDEICRILLLPSNNFKYMYSKYWDNFNNSIKVIHELSNHFDVEIDMIKNRIFELGL